MNDYVKNYVRTYFYVPPMNNMVYPYQNINHDPNLREKQTIYFLKKVVEWIENDTEYSNLKKLLSTFKNDKEYAFKLIYNLLRKYTKKTNTNWYDLKSHEYELFNYFKYNLKEELSSS